MGEPICSGVAAIGKSPTSKLQSPKCLMKNSQPTAVQAQPDPANLDNSELASNQEVKVVPWFAGQRKFAVTWISPISKITAKDAPTAGKK
jgi:hypothetical protein